MTKWIIPLHEVALRSSEITRLLLGRGAKVNITYLNSGTALLRVPQFRPHDMKLKMMELLIVYGVDVNAKPRVHGTALIAAIEDQNSILA